MYSLKIRKPQDYEPNQSLYIEIIQITKTKSESAFSQQKKPLFTRENLKSLPFVPFKPSFAPIVTITKAPPLMFRKSFKKFPCRVVCCFIFFQSSLRCFEYYLVQPMYITWICKEDFNNATLRLFLLSPFICFYRPLLLWDWLV